MSATGERLSPLDMLARLVSFDTESDKSNLALIDSVCAYLDGWGIPYLRLPNAVGDKAAVLATVGPMVDGGVVLSGHTDVVPVAGQAWSSDPFTLGVAPST
jgi:acetylornithine deacetylase